MPSVFYADCHVFYIVMLNVIMLSVVMLSVIKPNVIVLNVVMLCVIKVNVVMLSVVPHTYYSWSWGLQSRLMIISSAKPNLTLNTLFTFLIQNTFKQELSTNDIQELSSRKLANRHENITNLKQDLLTQNDQ
jgi:hypothetical protein